MNEEPLGKDLLKMGPPLFMKSLSKILLPLLIMLWLNGCMSVNTQIVGQTYKPLEPQEVHVLTLKEFHLVEFDQSLDSLLF